jgi:large subunit ribosomal protein L21e
MKGSDGQRRRTRGLSVKPRDRGKVSIRARLQKFKEQDKVSIIINPMYQSIPDPHFHGMTGKIVKPQGRAYYVRVSDGDKTKLIIVTPEHLRRVQ